MDTCRVCHSDSSVHHVVLAWQQDTTIIGSARPFKVAMGGADLPVTDVFAVEFDVKFSKWWPYIIFENIGSPVDVSFTVDTFSYDNRHPCISGARYHFDTSLVRVAYECRRDSGGPSQGIEIAHLRQGIAGWSRTTNIVTLDTVADLFRLPSIEVTRYHDTLTSLYPKYHFYSLTFERMGGTVVRHLAMDSDIQRVIGANFYSRKRPQLSVTRQQIDSDICQISLTTGGSPLYLCSGHDGFYKEMAEREYHTGEGKFGLTAVPNPSRGDVNISFTVPDEGEVFLEVYDQLGKQVTRMKQHSKGGIHNYLWRPENLPPGIYSIVLHFGNFQQVIRVAYIQ